VTILRDGVGGQGRAQMRGSIEGWFAYSCVANFGEYPFYALG
jgi:hypothetical protein